MFLRILALIALLLAPSLAFGDPISYSQTYEDLRRYEDAYADSYLADPEDSVSTVIDGDDAIDLIESAKGTAGWSSSIGADIYQLLQHQDAKAIFVEVDGAPPYVFVPFPDGFSPGGLAFGMIYDLETSSCTEIEASVGHQTGDWCACLAFCDGSGCTACAGSDQHDVPYQNDNLLFSTSEPSDVLSLWD